MAPSNLKSTALLTEVLALGESDADVARADPPRFARRLWKELLAEAEVHVTTVP